MTTTQILDRVAELLGAMGDQDRDAILAAVEMYGDARADEALAEGVAR